MSGWPARRSSATCRSRSSIVDTGMKFPRCTRSATATPTNGTRSHASRTARRSRRPIPTCRRPPAPRRARPLGLKNADRQASASAASSPASAATRRRPAPRSAIFSPRGDDGSWDFKRPAARVLGPVQDRPSRRARICASIRCCIGPRSTSGATSSARGSRSSLSISPTNGKRYRSLGDEDITSPVDSNAATLDEIIAELETTKAPERAGRAMDHETEDAFERLRSTGYM